MIEILSAGPLTSVQDANGRPAWRHLGVPVGGAADAWSARLANRLLGNTDDAALLEATLGGLELRVELATTIAHAGGLAATVDGIPVAQNCGTAVRAGSVVRVDAGSGARGYLAVAGGILVEPILGSRATDLRAVFGGHEGRALRAGDRLQTGARAGSPQRWVGAMVSGPIRMVAGPHSAAAPLEGEWTVSMEADRTGVRLDGGALTGGERYLPWACRSARSRFRPTGDPS